MIKGNRMHGGYYAIQRIEQVTDGEYEAKGDGREDVGIKISTTGLGIHSLNAGRWDSLFSTRPLLPDLGAFRDGIEVFCFPFSAIAWTT